MSAETKNFLAYYGVVAFIVGIVFSSGVLWANFYGHVSDGHPANLANRLTAIETDVRWIRDYLEPRNPRR